MTLFNQTEDTDENSVEARKDAFYNAIWIAAGQNHLTYSKETLRAFFDHWTEPLNPFRKNRGKKISDTMRFENEKHFSIKKRLTTWRNNEQKFNRASNYQSGEPSQEDDPSGFFNGLGI